MFVTGPCADPSIDVRACNYSHGQIDIGKNRVKYRAELFVSSVVAAEVHIHKCKQNVFAFDAFAAVIKGGKFELEADYSASKFIPRVGGHRGEGPCCGPH